ncbi:FAD-dependent oxidoreductase [archaeon]|nr:FAD-dependent oxidoreductase [archaeon]
MEEHDLIVIGAGPAGMTAGLYAAWSNIDSLVIETIGPGGQMATAHNIKNYPGFPDGIGGMELAELMKTHAENLGAIIKSLDEVKKVEKKGNHFNVTTYQGKYKAKAVIIATGLYRKNLGVPGEKEFKGMGVSYCATCDGPFFKDRRTVVIGSGTHAASEAIYLSDIASEVKLIMKRDHPIITNKDTERQLEESKIEVLTNTEVLEIIGTKMAGGIRVKDTKTGTERTIETDGVFIEAGRLPNIALLEGLDVKTDEKGYIITNALQETSIKGLYAAGDVTAGKVKQVGTAVGQGTIAALSARDYIKSMK